jgi:hypothetical protein
MAVKTSSTGKVFPVLFIMDYNVPTFLNSFLKPPRVISPYIICYKIIVFKTPWILFMEDIKVYGLIS